MSDKGVIKFPKNDEELDATSLEDLGRLVYQLQCQAEEHTSRMLDADVGIRTALLGMAKLDLTLDGRKPTPEEKRERLTLAFKHREAQLAFAMSRREQTHAAAAIAFYQAVAMNRQRKEQT